MKKKKNRKKLTNHHVNPKSRSHDNSPENLVKIPNNYHQAWHIVFGNLTPEEAHDFINKVFRSGKSKFTSKELCQIKEQLMEA